MSIYNIAENNQYKWTTTTGSILQEVPRIYANSHLFKDNDVLNQVKAWSEALKTTGGIQYYDQLHSLKNAEIDQWVFPFFGDDVRQISTSWGDNYVGSTNGTQGVMGSQTAGTVAGIASEVATIVGQVQSAINNSAGSLYEPPKFYNYKDIGEGTVAIEFSLINTINPGDYNKNYELIKRLIAVNKMSRGAGLIVEPAALWTVTIPGYRYIKWASASVDIKLVGQRKYIENKLVPEGYRITVSFTSLYTEPREYEQVYTYTLGT